MIREGGVLALGLLLTGCGGGAAPVPTVRPTIDHLSGAEVGAMAERELEAAHPGMAPGELTCPDLKWTVGTSVRCDQSALLSGGRRLRIPGTVTVTSIEGGGRLHVRLDDEVAEYGVDADYLSEDLAGVAEDRFGIAPSTTHCPYLAGSLGTTQTCTVTVADRQHRVVVRIVSRNNDRHALGYVFDWG